MEKVTKEIEVYIVDGKEFTDYEEALRYDQESLNKLKATYYVVDYAPDLTEGRGYYKNIIIGVLGYNKNAIHQYIIENLNKPLEMVMGVAAMDGYRISKPHKFGSTKDLKAFLEEKRTCGIGDYRKRVKPSLVMVNAEGKEV